MGDPLPSAAAERWSETWHLAGAESPPGLLEEILERHAEPHRHYHTLEHVMECLGWAEASRAIQTEPAAVDLALWFHDAVYEPLDGHNEARSSRLAEERLTGILPADVVGMIGSAILDTRHREAPTSPVGEVVVDADLAILGSEPERYERYRKAVREEYRLVPGMLYRRRRAAILRVFLERPAIYRTEWFRERLEARARENLERELAEL